MMNLQYIIVAVIILLAVFGLIICLVKKQDQSDCADCPLKYNCTRKKQKNSKNTCTGKK